MGAKQKPGQRKQSIQAPTGSRVARCLWIIDYGTQKQEYKGVAKDPAREIAFKFENVNDKHVFDEAKGPQPFTLLYPNFGGMKYTFSEYQGKKSKLWEMIDSWRGREFSEEEKLEGLDMETMLKKPALVTVQAKPSKNNPAIKYSNITAITNVPKEMGKVAPLTNEALFFEIGNMKNNQGMTQFEVFEKFPKFIQEKIALSPEWLAECVKHKYLPKTEGTAAPATNEEDDDVMAPPDDADAF